MTAMRLAGLRGVLDTTRLIPIGKWGSALPLNCSSMTGESAGINIYGETREFMAKRVNSPKTGLVRAPNRAMHATQPTHDVVMG